MEMPFNDPDAPIALTYGDVFSQTEQEYARWNFDVADTDTLLQHFKDAEAECARILDARRRPQNRSSASSWRIPPMTNASRRAMSSTCLTRAA